MRALLAEDDQRLGKLIKYSLKQYEITVVLFIICFFFF